jgi:hypothetical protein
MNDAHKTLQLRRLLLLLPSRLVISFLFLFNPRGARLLESLTLRDTVICGSQGFPASTTQLQSRLSVNRAAYDAP